MGDKQNDDVVILARRTNVRSDLLDKKYADILGEVERRVTAETLTVDAVLLAADEIRDAEQRELELIRQSQEENTRHISRQEKKWRFTTAIAIFAAITGTLSVMVQIFPNLGNRFAPIVASFWVP